MLLASPTPAAAAQQLTFPNAKQPVLRVAPPVATSGETLGQVVVQVATPVFSIPDVAAMPVRIAKEGSVVTALETTGQWYRIEFNDPQLGRSTGFIQKKDVSLVILEQTQMQPTDLSVVTAPVSSAAQYYTATAPASVPSQDRAPWTPSSFQRVWLDVNFGVSMSGADPEAFAFAGRLFSEPFGMAAAYAKPPRGAEFDFGGGYMFSQKAGIGLNFAGTAHRDTAGLALTVPHPHFFDSSGTAANVTAEELQRTEGAANIQMMFVPLHTDSVRVRLFGGPSYFRSESDMVQDIRYSQAASIFSPLNFVAITGYDAVKVEGTGWGYHVGGELTYFFSKVVGVGGFARYSRGSVSIDEPMSEVEQDVTVGGFQTGGGLRFRF